MTIIILASGNGTNAEAIIRHFRRVNDPTRFIIIASRPDAGVLDRAKRLNVEAKSISPAELKDGQRVLSVLAGYKPELIVLAGYLLKVPEEVVNNYPHRIINIHPALLPAYGGKGMYGDRVHRAVLDADEQQSGITIHEVDNQYDNGQILLQARCSVFAGDSVDSLAGRIHGLEHTYFPVVVKKLRDDISNI